MTRTDRAEADALAVQAAIARGEVIDAEESELCSVVLLTALQRNLLTLPGLVAEPAFACESVAELEVVVRQQLFAMLAEVASAGIKSIDRLDAGDLVDIRDEFSEVIAAQENRRRSRMV